jgi:hypothetical protein
MGSTRSQRLPSERAASNQWLERRDDGGMAIAVCGWQQPRRLRPAVQPQRYVALWTMKTYLASL